MTDIADPIRIFVVAGEESGDQIGGRLMSAFFRDPERSVSFFGVGGHRMIGHGLKSLFPMEELSLQGLTQIIPRIPALLARVRAAAISAVEGRADVVVLIDAPGFNLRVAKAIRRLDPKIPIIDYVGPTVWAYAPWRARAMTGAIDLVMAIFPFEPAEFQRLGGPRCVYTGHPLIEIKDRLRPSSEDERPPMTADGKRNFLLLPGSRHSELRGLLEPFGETLALLQARFANLETALPTPNHLVETVRKGIQAWPVKPRIVTGEEAKHAAFRSAHAALAASGTASLELAFARVPMVIGYKTDPLVRLLKPMMRVPSFVLPNIIAERLVVPELLDRRVKAKAMADAVTPLLDNTPQRDEQLAAFDIVDRRMSLADDLPSERAADLVRQMASRRRKPSANSP